MLPVAKSLDCAPAPAANASVTVMRNSVVFFGMTFPRLEILLCRCNGAVLQKSRPENCANYYGCMLAVQRSRIHGEAPAQRRHLVAHALRYESFQTVKT